MDLKNKLDDVKVSNDEEQIMKIFDTEIETDIKSGWEKI